MSKVLRVITPAICLMLPMGCVHNEEQKLSNHFDGEKFFNPTLENQFSPSFTDIFRMMREGRAKWPEQVENHGVPEIRKEIGADELALTFVNHATFLIQLPNVNILTDPVWSPRASPFSWLGPKRVRAPGVPMDDLPHIHVVVISHNHYDHLDVETLKAIDERFSPTVIVPIGDRELIESIGIRNVQELDWWDSVEVHPDVHITFTPTQHSSARGLFDRDKSLWGSYLITHGERSVYFGGDAGYSTYFVDIRTRLGAPEIALLGIGSYAPRFFMQQIHMNPAEAVRAHLDLKASLSVGMHFGTFQLSSEAFDQPLRDLHVALDEQQVSDSSFTIFKEGETRIYRKGHDR